MLGQTNFSNVFPKTNREKDHVNVLYIRKHIISSYSPPLHHVPLQFNRLDYLWGHTESLVYSAQIDTEEARHQRNVTSVKPFATDRGPMKSV